MIVPATEPALVLRDIHVPAAPGWWPPAPGWWIVAALLVALVCVASWMAWRRRRRRLALRKLFDDTLAAAGSPAAQVAAMSGLLRRAARQRDARAATLQGDDWIGFLDAGADHALFDAGLGRLLLEGGFRPALDATDVDALRPCVRQRFLEWMGAT